jgi:hypothetical protein
VKQLLAMLALALTCLVPAYADVIYTASPDFLSNVQPGYYTETFDENYGPMPPRDYGDGTFTFNASAAANLYQVRGVLSLVTPRVPLVITITGADVNAIGGNFFITNGSGSFRPVGVSIALSNGTTQTFTPATLEDSYRGFVTDAFITSLTIDIAAPPLLLRHPGQPDDRPRRRPGRRAGTGQPGYRGCRVARAGGGTAAQAQNEQELTGRSWLQECGLSIARPTCRFHTQAGLSMKNPGFRLAAQIALFLPINSAVSPGAPGYGRYRPRSGRSYLVTAHLALHGIKSPIRTHRFQLRTGCR